MFLSKIRENCKTWQTTMIEIVVAFLLFLVINDKITFNHLFRSFQNIGNISIDNLLYEMVNFGHMITINSSLYMVIGIFVCQFVLLGVLIIVLEVNKPAMIEVDDNSIKNDDRSVREDKKEYTINKLYLTTNKFIS